MPTTALMPAWWLLSQVKMVESASIPRAPAPGRFYETLTRRTVGGELAKTANPRGGELAVYAAYGRPRALSSSGLGADFDGPVTGMNPHLQA